MNSVDLQTSGRLYQLMVHHLTLYQRSTGAYPPGKLGGGGGGGKGGMAALLKFPNQTRSTVTFSNIRDIAFYGCSEIIRTRNFRIFTALC